MLVPLSAAMIAPLTRHRSAVGQPTGTMPVAGSLIFERNDGQHPSACVSLPAARALAWRCARARRTVTLSTAGGPVRVAMQFEGARPGVAPQGERQAAARAHYLVGRDPRAWRTDVPTFERVRYARLYDGIDLVFYGNGGQLEYDVVVGPQSRPDVARLRFVGARSVRVASDGALMLDLTHAELRYSKPIAYQQIDGVRRPVDVAYRLDGDVVTFEAGTYDRSRELVDRPGARAGTARLFRSRRRSDHPRADARRWAVDRPDRPLG